MKRLKENLENKNNHYLYPFFWQHGESLDVIKEYMDQMYTQGIYHICIESRPHPEFLAEGWWETMDCIIHEAKKRNMKIWILDDARFPTGYANGKVPKHLKKRYLNYRRFDVVGTNEQVEINLDYFVDMRELMRDKRHQEDCFFKAILVENDVTDKKSFKEETLQDVSHCYDNHTLHLSLENKHYSVFVLYETICGEETTQDYLDPMRKEATQVLIDEVYEKHFQHYQDEFGKTIVGLEQMTSGQLIYKGQDVSKKKIRNQLKYNKDVQMIFQDAFSSLNPRKTIYDIIAEPIRNFEKLDADTENKRIHELLDIVGLPKQALEQYPFQFSGGQQQRIGIARAVATNPKLIVADEPVSALDLSVQAQVLNFMKLIQKNLGIAFLFISHDLGVVRHMTDTIAVMHNGRIVEKGTRRDIFDEPQHIYTKRLLSAIPSIDVTRRAENRKNRLKVEQDFEDKKANFYDKHGHALPLKKLSESHWAALPKGGENVESNY